MFYSLSSNRMVAPKGNELCTNRSGLYQVKSQNCRSSFFIFLVGFDLIKTNNTKKLKNKNFSKKIGENKKSVKNMKMHFFQ